MLLGLLKQTKTTTRAAEQGKLDYLGQKYVP